MGDLTNLAKYGPTGVAILAISGLIWLVNKFFGFIKEWREYTDKVMHQQQEFAGSSLLRIEKLQKETVSKLAKSVDKNTEATAKSTEAAEMSMALQKENLTFLKNLNGKLAPTAQKIIDEKTVQQVNDANRP